MCLTIARNAKDSSLITFSGHFITLQPYLQYLHCIYILQCNNTTHLTWIQYCHSFCRYLVHVHVNCSYINNYATFAKFYWTLSIALLITVQSEQRKWSIRQNSGTRRQVILRLHELSARQRETANSNNDLWHVIFTGPVWSISAVTFF